MQPEKTCTIMVGHYLDRLFTPESIAVFGASEKANTVGSIVFDNLLTGGFEGQVYPVNPKYDELRGEKCYRSIDTIRDSVDLAVIATPAKTVPGIIRQCGEQGVRAAIVLSAGFGEGEGEGTGKRLERAMLAEAKRFGIRILGPNCLGLIRPSKDREGTPCARLPVGSAVHRESGLGQRPPGWLLCPGFHGSCR